MGKFTIEREINGKTQDIELCRDDVEAFILQASSHDIRYLYNLCKDEGDIDDDCDCDKDTKEETAADYLILETMADERKMEFIASVFEKYTLEQFEEKLSYVPLKAEAMGIVEMLESIQRYDMTICGQPGAESIEEEQYSSGDWIKARDIEDIVDQLK